MTWECFTRLFRDKYLGEARLASKVREFIELAWFVPTIVPTNDARKMKYMLGLRTEIVKKWIAIGKDLNLTLMHYREPFAMTDGTSQEPRK